MGWVDCVKMSSPVLRRGQLPRISKHRDTTVSDKEDVPDAYTRYRESGLVPGLVSAADLSSLSICFLQRRRSVSFDELRSFGQ